MRHRHQGQRIVSAERLDPRLRAGLAAWWVADGSGLTLRDRSGYQHSGTLTNGPLWSLDPDGRGAIEFDGSDDRVVVGDRPVFALSTTYSISIRFRTRTPSAYQGMLSTGSAGAGAIFVGLYLGRIFLQTNDYTDTGNAVTDDQWHIATWTYDGTNARTYLDGVLGQTKAIGAPTVADNPVVIGWEAAAPFNGWISEVFAHRRALTGAEVRILADRNLRTAIPPRRHGHLSIPLQSVAITGSGGIAADGAATVQRGATSTGSGGFLTSGAATTKRGRALTATGGLTASGAATLRRGVARTGSGGLRLGGSGLLLSFDPDLQLTLRAERRRIVLRAESRTVTPKFEKRRLTIQELIP